MDVSYNVHAISATANQNPDTGRWVPWVVITSPETTMTPLRGPLEGFETRDEAEIYGVALGKKWIDDGKPNPRKAASKV